MISFKWLTAGIFKVWDYGSPQTQLGNKLQPNISTETYQWRSVIMYLLFSDLLNVGENICSLSLTWKCTQHTFQPVAYSLMLLNPQNTNVCTSCSKSVSPNRYAKLKSTKKNVCLLFRGNVELTALIPLLLLVLLGRCDEMLLLPTRQSAENKNPRRHLEMYLPLGFGPL